MKRCLILIFSGVLFSCQPAPENKPLGEKSVTESIEESYIFGIYNQNAQYIDLRKTLTSGFSDFRLQLPKESTFIPLVGNWGYGLALVLFDSANCTFVFYNDMSMAAEHHRLNLGCSGAKPQAIAGDWNGDGSAEVGVYYSDIGVAALNQDNLTPSNILRFEYGQPNAGLIAFTGDWNKDGVFSLGLWNPQLNRFDLINRNAAGVADISFAVDKKLSKSIPFAVVEKGKSPSIGLYSSEGGGFHVFSIESFQEINTIEFGEKGLLNTPVTVR